MKKYLYGTLPLFVLCLSSCSQVETAIGIDFFHGTFEEALQLADEEEKLVFVDVYTSWCGPCKVMSQTVFPDEEVGEYFNARFVSYKLDAEDMDIDGPRISNTYDVRAYPTLLFLNPDGTEIGRGVSGYDIEGLLGLAEDVLNQQSKNPERLAELSAQYEGGDREKDLVQEYLHVASLVSGANYGAEASYELSQKMQPVFDEYIETHLDDVTTLINGKDFQLIRGYAARRPKSHPAVALVVENFDSFAEVVPEFALCYFVIETNYSTVIDLAQAGDSSYKDHIALLDTELAHAHSVIAAEDPSNAILKDQLMPRAKTQYLIGTNDWDGYLAEVDAKLEKAADDAEKARIKGRAASWLMNSGDEKFVQIGDEYATTAYKADKTQPVNVLNYSSVLIKSGQLDAALEIYEEMLSTLDPSHPSYNFKNALESSIARVKAMMDESSENESDTQSNIDT
ncbi:MAG: thioredoxin family protein [Gammaproteobacteria bacterium]|nr:thioredoxin family protein [Gammaproteobacteria bacterium]